MHTRRRPPSRMRAPSPAYPLPLLAVAAVIFVLVCLGSLVILYILLSGGITGLSTPPAIVATLFVPPDTPTPTLIPTPTITPTPTLTPTSTPPPILPSQIDLEALLAQMSLEEKVGQLIASGISGATLLESENALFSQAHIGAVVYFAANTLAPGQARRLSSDLQSLSQANSHGIPLLIGVDHEGGQVFRFQSGATHFPNLMALGAANSPDLAYQAGAANAEELRAAGINLSLGPVVDVNDQPDNPVIGLRAFGGFPDRVSQLGAAYVNGLQNYGVIAAPKHFPGHGSTAIDSHFTLPVIDKTLDQLRQNDLLPFAASIQAGAGVVMVGHIANPQVDPSGAPASLSASFIEGLLRGELGFQGVVMTDAMSMGAIQQRYDVATAAVLAVQAGNDLLAYPQAGDALVAHQALLAAVNDSRIPLSRIEASARRMLALKARFGLFDNPLPGSPDIAYDVHQALVEQIARQALTFLGQPADLPALNAQRVLVISPDRLPPGSAIGDNLTLLGELLQGRGLEVAEFIYTVGDPFQAAMIQEAALGQIQDYPLALLVTWDARLRQLHEGDGSQVTLIQALSASGVPVVYVAASSPYDLGLFPAGRPAFTTYGGLEAQVVALVEALLNAQPPPGGLPVGAR